MNAHLHVELKCKQSVDHLALVQVLLLFVRVVDSPQGRILVGVFASLHPLCDLHVLVVLQATCATKTNETERWADQL